MNYPNYPSGYETYIPDQPNVLLHHDDEVNQIREEFELPVPATPTQALEAEVSIDSPETILQRTREHIDNLQKKLQLTTPSHDSVRDALNNNRWVTGLISTPPVTQHGYSETVWFDSRFALDEAGENQPVYGENTHRVSILGKYVSALVRHEIQEELERIKSGEDSYLNVSGLMIDTDIPGMHDGMLMAAVANNEQQQKIELVHTVSMRFSEVEQVPPVAASEIAAPLRPVLFGESPEEIAAAWTASNQKHAIAKAVISQITGNRSSFDPLYSGVRHDSLSYGGILTQLRNRTIDIEGQPYHIDAVLLRSGRTLIKVSTADKDNVEKILSLSIVSRPEGNKDDVQIDSRFIQDGTQEDLIQSVAAKLKMSRESWDELWSTGEEYEATSEQTSNWHYYGNGNRGRYTNNL